MRQLHLNTQPLSITTHTKPLSHTQHVYTHKYYVFNSCLQAAQQRERHSKKQSEAFELYQKTANRQMALGASPSVYIMGFRNMYKRKNN